MKKKLINILVAILLGSTMIGCNKGEEVKDTNSVHITNDNEIVSDYKDISEYDDDTKDYVKVKNIDISDYFDIDILEQKRNGTGAYYLASVKNISNDLEILSANVIIKVSDDEESNILTMVSSSYQTVEPQTYEVIDTYYSDVCGKVEILSVALTYRDTYTQEIGAYIYNKD